jgi:hypothetical protein
MAEENANTDAIKAGFKAILTVLIQIRERKTGVPTGTETAEAIKLFNQFYGDHNQILKSAEARN